jgi:hypothetical protein
MKEVIEIHYHYYIDYLLLCKVKTPPFGEVFKISFQILVSLIQSLFKCMPG